MATNTKIEWCDHTFNPWEGCTKVSPGCANCYAEARNKRWAGGANWGPGAPRRRTSEANWRQPLKWNEDQQERYIDRPAGTPIPDRPRVFCASLADWLDDEAPIPALADLLELIKATPNLDWLLLTKRPQNWMPRMACAVASLMLRGKEVSWLYDWRDGRPPANVWIGTTVEDQQRADERIPQLLAIPARVRFLSCEPLLEEVDLRLMNHLSPLLIHWVICGGESGPKSRPFVVEWADDLRRQCAAAGVAFFMKQLGANPRTSNANALDWPDATHFEEDDDGEGSAAGARVRLADRAKGGDEYEFPYELRIREFPEVTP